MCLTFVDLRLVREIDFFVYFEKLLKELAVYTPLDTTLSELKEGVELRDRIMYPNNYELKFEGNSFG